MKNKQVEELVEWVAEIISPQCIGATAEVHLGLTEYNKRRRTRAIHRAVEILSHPDLALIDTAPMVKVDYLPVIRLAEALKEVVKE